MEKRYLLLLLLLMPFAQTRASEIFYFGGGMNLTVPVGNKVFNGVVTEYNSSRSYLSTPMKPLRWMYGGQAMVGLMLGKGLTFEMYWAGSHQKMFAEGTPASGILTRREVKARNNMFSLGMGYTFLPGKVFRPGIMVSADFGNFREFTRSGVASDIDNVKFADVHKTLEIGIGIMPTFNFYTKKYVGFSIRPYYQAQLLKEDLMYLMDAVNPNSPYPDKTSETNSHFGVQVALFLYFGRNERY